MESPGIFVGKFCMNPVHRFHLNLLTEEEPCRDIHFIDSCAGVKKSENVHLSSGQVHLEFYLSCRQITLAIQGNIDIG